MKYLLLVLLAFIYVPAFCQEPGHATLYFSSHENSRVAVDSVYYYQCSAFDSSGKALSFSAETLPAWLIFNAESRTLLGKPGKAGQYRVTLAVSNGTIKAYQHFMLTVYNKNTVNILCLGNSITNGTNKFNSYRRALWQMLHKGNYNIDMVGSWSKHHWGGDVPNPDFDMEHDGHSGWTAEHIFNPPDWDSTRGNIKQWLLTYSPDIVLVELGTNDVFQCRKAADVIANFTQLLQVLRNSNSSVKIFIAQIPPLGEQWAPKKLCGDSVMYDTRIRELNKAILAFTKQNTTLQSPVIAVDQFTGVNPKTDMYDDIHPNDIGEKRMAERWFVAIKKYLKPL